LVPKGQIKEHKYLQDLLIKEIKMNQEIFLMNFRIPSGLKMQFEETCHQLRTNMTAEMNRMIRDFVKNSREDLYEPVSWFYGNGDDDDN
jgi:predicted glycosyltransferase